MTPALVRPAGMRHRGLKLRVEDQQLRRMFRQFGHAIQLKVMAIDAQDGGLLHLSHVQLVLELDHSVRVVEQEGVLREKRVKRNN